MNLSADLALSYYSDIATLNNEHKIHIVQHQSSKQIYVKKYLDVYNANIYRYLHATPIEGIPHIFEVFEEETSITIIEEYISGETLQNKINNKTLTESDINFYIYELCSILYKLHSMNPPIIHRDIKPSNIILTPHNHIVLLDFNAAKYHTDSKASDTVLLGTKGYAAPEQYGFGSSSAQTDIYAIGILLKEMVSSLNIITNKFDNIIKKCTHLDPSDRYSSVLELQKQFHIEPKSTDAVNNINSSFALPGFRSHTKTNMIVASIVYFLVVYFCCLLELESPTNTFVLWLYRFTVLIMFFSILLSCFNYRNFLSYIPLCNSKYKIVRYIGCILFNVILFFILCIILSFFG